jgi:sugar lactone lactonase YvrE
MYIADTGNNAVTQYDWTSAGYQFANTQVGSTSSDSPVTYTFFNLGNAELTMSIPSSGTNPSMSNSAFSLGSGTTCPELSSSSSTAGTLAPLASCLLTFNFQPTAASFTSGNATYVNNSLNVTGTSSAVALFGTGTAPPGDATHVTFATLPSSLYSGQSATVSVTVADTPTPATIPTGSVSFNDSIQGSLGSATINGSGVASLGSITFTGAGTHTITASYGGVSGSFVASSNTASITVSNAPAATIGTPPPSLNLGSVAVGQTSSTQTVTFTFSTTGAIGQPQVLTLGASGNTQPFRSVTGGTCLNYGTSTVWTASSTCTMLVQFTPAYPGVALGAVVMVDLSGNVLSTAYITATGTGPLAATLPSTAHSVTATGVFQGTTSLAFDGSGRLYFADLSGNQVFRLPNSGGAVTLIAGTGTAGSTGDGGAAASAALSQPSDVALDGAGNLYIADYGNNRVRMVSAATGIITTVAGNGTSGFSGDNGPATSAELNGPTGLALDGAGNLYIADQYNYVIRKVTAATGVITTAAGNGTQGFSGDGGPATSAQLKRPYGVAVDGAGNLYIADKNNNRIRMVSASSGHISTVAGNGDSSDSGDGGLATQAGLFGPLGVAVDAAGNLAIVDSGAAIRLVLAASGVIETDAVNVGNPTALREDGAGNLYTADALSGGLYIASPTTSFTYPTTTAVGSSDATDGPQTALFLNIGNSALTAVTPGLTAPADFAKVAGSGTPADCTASFSLTAGAACTLALEFEPSTVGSLGESFTITDNSLNSSSTTPAAPVRSQAGSSPSPPARAPARSRPRKRATEPTAPPPRPPPPSRPLWPRKPRSPPPAFPIPPSLTAPPSPSARRAAAAAAK